MGRVVWGAALAGSGPYGLDWPDALAPHQGQHPPAIA